MEVGVPSAPQRNVNEVGHSTSHVCVGVYPQHESTEVELNSVLGVEADTVGSERRPEETVCIVVRGGSVGEINFKEFTVAKCSNGAWCTVRCHSLEVGGIGELPRGQRVSGELRGIRDRCSRSDWLEQFVLGVEARRGNHSHTLKYRYQLRGGIVVHHEGG